MVFLIKLKSKDDIVHHCTALSVHNICCRWIVLGDLVQQWPTYNQVYLSWIKQFSKGTMSCPTNRQVYTYIKYKQCTVHSCIQSSKFKRVSLNETLEFPFWRLNFYVDFGLRNSQQMENMKKLIKIIFHNKNIDIHKTA